MSVPIYPYLPAVPADSSISSVFSSISGKYDQVSRYNETTKLFEHYVGNAKYDQFDILEYGRGYQIYITAADGAVLTIDGSVPENKNILLKTGYNLIFSPARDAASVEQALKPLKLGIDYEKILSYNKDTNQFVQYPNGSLTQLESGKAYYVKCLKDITWTIQNSKAITEFIYDGDGGRVKKITPNATTAYIGSLFEIDSNGATRRNIFAGSSRVCTVESTDKKYFNHKDHIGSSNIVTDISGGQAGLTEFSPYGAISKQSGSYDPKYKFTGKELDVSTGLYYYSARYYDPQLGRFIQADTIVPDPSNPQDLNRYSYCSNNPINYIDPSGHSWFGDNWKSIVSIAATVVSIFVPPLAPAMTALNFSISAYTAIDTGNIGALGGGMVGGILGGGIGQGVGKTFAAGALGESSFSFVGGALIGAGEFGVSGFASGFGGALASGANFKDSLRSGGMGAAIGAASGAVIQGSYAAGWQDKLHGLGEDDLVNASGYRKIGVGSREAFGGPARHKFIKYRESGKPQFWEMGSDDYGNIAINSSSTRNATDAAIKNHQIKLATTVVNNQLFKTQMQNYQRTWVGYPYAKTYLHHPPYNSNYAADYVVYGSGGNISSDLGWCPGSMR